MPPIVTPQRFAQGMSFDEYMAYVGSPENLARELDIGPRTDYSAFLRESFEARRLNQDQGSALRWLVSQPNGPAKMLVISEDWSSDCRRDVPTFARMATETGMDLRIFTRDGRRYYDDSLPPDEQPADSNGDLMARFLNYKDGRYWPSIPVCAFFTRDFEYLYHYSEYPALYHKDHLAQNEGTPYHGDQRFAELLNSPFYRIWTSAAVDEMLSALHRRVVLGAV